MDEHHLNCQILPSGQRILRLLCVVKTRDLQDKLHSRQEVTSRMPMKLGRRGILGEVLRGRAEPAINRKESILCQAILDANNWELGH